MHIIIIGGGEAGYPLAQALSQNQKHDLVVVDPDAERSARFSHLDVRYVKGRSTDPNVLKQADIEKCDLLIATTRQGEINIVSCSLGHKLQPTAISHRVARTHNRQPRTTSS